MTDGNEFKTVVKEFVQNVETKRVSINGNIETKTEAFEQEECNITSYLSFNYYNDFVQEFEDILREKFPKENTKYFYQNIKQLKIKESKNGIIGSIKKIFSSSTTQGTYSDYKNTINIFVKNNKDKDELKSTLMHELLHMSSSSDPSYSGFENLISNKFWVGRGINEGYTEKLNREVFSKVVNHDIYDKEVVLASGIERIVEKENMQDSYFNADVMKLIRYLSFYEPDKTEVINLITDIDKLDRIKDEYDADEKYFELRCKIASIYQNKIDIQRRLRQIDDETYERKKFLYVDRYIASHIPYGDNVVIKEYDEIYSIRDGEYSEIIKKDSVKLKFKPDEVKLIRPKKDLEEMFEKEDKNVEIKERKGM